MRIERLWGQSSTSKSESFCIWSPSSVGGSAISCRSRLHAAKVHPRYSRSRKCRMYLSYFR
jgi:hypothetical protein